MTPHNTPRSDQSNNWKAKVPDAHGISDIEVEDELKRTDVCTQDLSAVFAVCNTDHFDEPSQDSLRSRQSSVHAISHPLRPVRIYKKSKVLSDKGPSRARSHGDVHHEARRSVWRIAIDFLRRKTKLNLTTTHVKISTVGYSSVPKDSGRPSFETQDEAAAYAVHCVEKATGLQSGCPPDFIGAGVHFLRAVDAYARAGLFCSEESASAHTAYAQNFSKRGNRVESEYHVRMAADIYRVLNARTTRRYGDCLLHLAGVVDKQGRLEEAEELFNSALAVYRINKVFDKNVRMAIAGLRKNLCSQGRHRDADMIKQRQLADTTV